jgi:hypothetical protein
MPSRSLSDTEIERLTTWPAEVARSDVVAFFTLNLDDLRWVRSHRGAANRLGLAVQLCALAFLGFIPDDLSATPSGVVTRLADRVGVASSALDRYGDTVIGRVRREHVAWVIDRAGWRTCGRGEWKRLGDWLVERALEHDTPSVLLHQALEHLRAERVVRPGLDRLMRAIGTARVTADEEIHHRLSLLLIPSRRDQLDGVALTDGVGEDLADGLGPRERPFGASSSSPVASSSVSRTDS